MSTTVYTNTSTPLRVAFLHDLNRFVNKGQATKGRWINLLSLHQIVGTADLRISLSAVMRGRSSINAVAPMTRSTGSFG